jgi:PAS domain-containing protein
VAKAATRSSSIGASGTGASSSSRCSRWPSIRWATAALRASEASYRALVETQTEFVLRLRPDGRLTFVNETYCR